MKNKISGRSIIGGIIGGFIGATVMTLILIGSKAMMGMPVLADFVIMGTFVGGTGNAAISAGFLAHYLLGMILGAVLGIIVSSVELLRLTSWKKATGIGLLYGAIIWLIIFLYCNVRVRSNNDENDGSSGCGYASNGTWHRFNRTSPVRSKCRSSRLCRNKISVSFTAGMHSMCTT